MKKLYLLFTFALGCMLWACDSDEKSNEYDDFYVVESQTTIQAEGGSGYINFIANGSVSANSNQPWCTVTVNGESIDVTVSENHDISERAAMITLSSGSKQIKVPVVQYGSIIWLSDIDTIKVDYKAQQQTYSLVSGNKPINIDVKEDWVTYTIDDDGNVVFDIETNLGDVRYCDVEITIGGESKTFVISQELYFEVGTNTTYLKIEGLSGGEKKIPVGALSPFTATSDSAWCTTSIEDYMGNYKALTITVGPAIGPRTTTVYVTLGNTTKTILIEQVPAYEDLLGSWKFGDVEDVGEVDVTIAQKVEKTSYDVTGISFNGFDLPFVITYEDNKFYISAQYSGPWTTYYIWYCPWDTAEGYLTWTTSVKLEGTWNANGEITFGDCGSWEGQKADGILLYAFRQEQAASDNAAGSLASIENVRLRK